MNCRTFNLCLLLYALIAVHCGQAIAQTSDPKVPPPPIGPTIDQQLLEGLNSPPKAVSPQPPVGDRSGASERLGQIAEQMRAAERRLANRDTSPTTQAMQRKIVDGLAQLLEQSGASAGTAQRAPPSSEQQNAPVQPGEGSPELGTASGVPGPAERRPQNSAQQQNQGINHWLDQMWGHLPERVRSQMRAPRSEHFLPKYERTIEQYYLRLAEEQENAP